MKRSLGARTLLYPTPVLVIGTWDTAGKPNLMAAAWGGICCSQPPCVAVAVRRNRHTYAGLIEHGAFTVSVTSEALAAEADFTGTVSGAEVDKFAAAGLTPVESEIVDAPWPDEFPMVLECTLRHTVEIGVHTQFVGEIMDIKVEESLLDEKGVPDLERLQPIFYDPGRGGYWTTGRWLADAYSLGRRFSDNSDQPAGRSR